MTNADDIIATPFPGEQEGREFVRAMGPLDTMLFTTRPDRWITYSGDQ